MAAAEETPLLPFARAESEDRDCEPVKPPVAREAIPDRPPDVVPDLDILL